MTSHGRLIWTTLTVCLGIIAVPHTVVAQQKKPNILVIWDDDIGIAENTIVYYSIQSPYYQ